MRRHLRTNPAIISELKRIAQSSGGILIPEKVIEAAKPSKSILHDSFTWDNNEAAHQYRLYQARVIIRTTVRLVEVNGDIRPVRVFVSLTPDREEDGGGYREIVAVMSDKDLRRQLLEDALNELQSFEVKYAHLKELSGVFVASKKARDSLVSAWAA